MLIAEGGVAMKKTKYWLILSPVENRILLASLIRLKNKLIQQGRYTDCVDELIARVAY